MAASSVLSVAFRGVDQTLAGEMSVIDDAVCVGGTAITYADSAYAISPARRSGADLVFGDYLCSFASEAEAAAALERLPGRTTRCRAAGNMFAFGGADGVLTIDDRQNGVVSLFRDLKGVAGAVLGTPVSTAVCRTDAAWLIEGKTVKNWVPDSEHGAPGASGPRVLRFVPIHVDETLEGDMLAFDRGGSDFARVDGRVAEPVYNRLRDGATFLASEGSERAALLFVKNWRRLVVMDKGLVRETSSHLLKALAAQPSRIALHPGDRYVALASNRAVLVVDTRDDVHMVCQVDHPASFIDCLAPCSGGVTGQAGFIAVWKDGWNATWYVDHFDGDKIPVCASEHIDAAVVGVVTSASDASRGFATVRDRLDGAITHIMRIEFGGVPLDQE